MKQPRRILLTGRRGQVGWELARSLSTLGEVIALDSSQLDLTDGDAIRRLVAQLQPAIIVNPAAHTAVDKAESESDLAYAINATAPGILAEEAEKLGALLVHYSTDYVFNGQPDKPWREDDAKGPLNVYGRSKLAGELAIQTQCQRHLIFRTSWVYGLRGANFLLTMRRLMRERPELKIVADQIGAPTWCRSLADATAQVLAQLVLPQQGSAMFAPWGVYHMSNAGETSWHGFAELIQTIEATSNAADRTCQLLPIPSSDYPTPAQRPLNSRLSNEKLAQGFGLRLPSWQDALHLCMDK